MKVGDLPGPRVRGECVGRGGHPRTAHRHRLHGDAVGQRDPARVPGVGPGPVAVPVDGAALRGSGRRRRRRSDLLRFRALRRQADQAARDGRPGAATELFGAVRRPDGQVQITVGGRLVYRFSGDSKPGDLNGQGLDGKWFAVAPTGQKAAQ
ncbi:hypothetical protein ACWC2H_31695 [Streptomyces sp. 900105755]